MMTMRNSIPLPAPHSAVRVVAEAFQWGVLVEYVGPSMSALREAGCISSMMESQFGPRPRHGRARRDEYGNQFNRIRKPLKASPDRVVLSIHVRSSREHALALPGVAACLVDRAATEPPLKRVRTFRDLAAEFAGTAQGYGVGHGNPVYRDRQVGRFQRCVQWASIGALLLIPNWRQVREQARR